MPCLQERDVLCHTSSSNLLSALLQHALYIPAQGQDLMSICSLAFPSRGTPPSAPTAVVCIGNPVHTIHLHSTIQLFSEHMYNQHKAKPETIRDTH